MGFDLMKNFNRPYFSRSIHEFWSRWHISLSTWFKDYLYISLGGNRVPVPQWYFNLFFVFLISGLWHGANWTFLIWGGLNGFYLIFSLMTKNIRDKVARITGYNKLKRTRIFISIVITFALASISWVFFRANSLSDGIYILKHFFSPGVFFIPNPSVMVFSVFAILCLLAVEFKEEFFAKKFFILHNKKAFIRYAAYLTLIILIVLIGVFDGGQFIYFQF